MICFRLLFHQTNEVTILLHIILIGIVAIVGGSIYFVLPLAVQLMFLREITHTINAFNEMADIVRLYSKKPKTAEQRLANLLSEVLYEDSESV